MNVGYDNFFGCDRMFIESEPPNPHHRVHYTEEPIDGVEVSLVDDGRSFVFLQTRDDVECTKEELTFGEAERCFATGVKNLSASSQTGSVSSVVSSEFSSSQRSYLQLAIPTTLQKFDENGIECSLEQLQRFENDDVISSHDLPNPACDRGVGSSHPEVSSDQSYQYRDSQETSYEPKPRPIFLGARRSRVSMHSRIEWWNHQLSKPLRALAGGKRSFRSPLSDCLGQQVVHTISAQPRRANDNSKVNHSELDWADFSSQVSVDTLVERDCESIITETLRDHTNWSTQTDARKDDMSFQIRDHLSPPIPPVQKYCYNTSLTCDSDLSPGAEHDSPLPAASAGCPIAKKIVLIDFDARTLITHQGVEEDSSDDDSAVHIDWDLG
jgi:hypothetical protein